jgi:CubicO group peptidase (beta-lactamase class C family)
MIRLIMIACFLPFMGLTQKLSMVNGKLGVQLDSMVNEEVKRGFSGSVIVAQKGKILLQKGYGWTDSLNKINITPLTKFYLASTTKGVTGVAALIAEQKGILSLQEPIGKYFTDAPEAFKKITMHQMLIHYSGLSDDYKTFGYPDKTANVKEVFGDTLKRKPGAEFIYASAGLWLTAAIIENAAKEKYEDFVKTKLFAKAGMKNTDFWFQADENNPHVFAQKLSAFPPDNLPPPNWGYRASGGVTTNAVDLYKYWESIFKTHKILKPESIKQLVGPHANLGRVGVGYGWFTTTTSRKTAEIWSRGGESFGHNSAIRWFTDENVVIIILTSCGELGKDELEANRSVSNKLEKLIFK